MRLLAIGVCEHNEKVLVLEKFGRLSLPVVEVVSGEPRDELKTFFLRSLGVEVEIGKLFGEKYITDNDELLLFYIIPPISRLKEAREANWVKMTGENLKKMDLANVVDILLENPVKEILKLQEIVERNMDRCPWGSQQTIEDALKELISEIEEFEAELDVKNWTKAFFEVGDIVYDALLLAWIYAREHDVTPDTILRKVNNKISKRKPWLFSETRISLEEAKKLWNYYKSLES